MSYERIELLEETPFGDIVVVGEGKSLNFYQAPHGALEPLTPLTNEELKKALSEDGCMRLTNLLLQLQGY